MHNIGIIGLGFVGDALRHGFKTLGVNDIALYDPYKIPGSKITDVSKTDILFVCVPTPMKNGGDIDTKALDDVLIRLHKTAYKGVIVIKSTVRPDVVTKLSLVYFKLNLVTNPEFLTERTAQKDFLTSEWIILGGKTENVTKVEEFYSEIFKGKVPITKTTLETAMMAKYMTNAFFAVKISLLNEFYQIWTKMGNENWNDLIWVFAQDKRVGLHHLKIPGPDGDLGFGGKCLAGHETLIIHDGKRKRLITFSELYEESEHINISNWKVLSLNTSNKQVEIKPLEGIKRREVNETIRIQTSKGLRLESSIDHGYLVYDIEEDVFRKKEAQEIKIGDYVASVIAHLWNDLFEVRIDLKNFECVRWYVVNNPPSEEEMKKHYSNKLITYHQLVRWRSGDRHIIPKHLWNENMGLTGLMTNSSSFVNPHINIDFDFSRLIGYYLAEGNITDNKTYFSFSLHEDHYINDLCKILTNLGFNFSIRINKYKGKDSSKIIKVNHQLLSETLLHLGCGKNAYDKRLPTEVTGLNIWNCLSGYFRGDGTVHNGTKRYVGLNVASQSKILIEQIQAIFRACDIFPSYTEKRGKKSKGISYQLNINRKEDILIINKRLSLLDEEHKVLDKAELINDGGSGYLTYLERDWAKLVRVTKIELLEERKHVYSIQVTDNRNFITSGGLVVANCFPKDLNAMMSLAKKLNIPNNVMGGAWETNKQVRNNKNWLKIYGAVTDDYEEESDCTEDQ